MREPAVVGTPSVQKMSLTAIGTPAQRSVARTRRLGRARRDPQIGAELGVEALDPLAVGVEQLRAATARRARSRSIASAGGQLSVGVAHCPGVGTRKPPCATSGAPSRIRSVGQLSRGSSARSTFSSSITCDVGLDSLQVELRDLLDVVEHARELARHALDLVLVQAKPREPRDVQDLIAVDHG